MEGFKGEKPPISLLSLEKETQRQRQMVQLPLKDVAYTAKQPLLYKGSLCVQSPVQVNDNLVVYAESIDSSTFLPGWELKLFDDCFINSSKYFPSLIGEIGCSHSETHLPQVFW